ncbi:response regulator transcription factor [Desmospora profundinema]|uniref:DNA-binding response OmpR family regulator n=1 Tax=Desmospora profundinema TaxID=1571184 RepID=A0ABU1ILS6_9BACL|nr:response regulator transcription factor [Desmospora profundinema]MDR6224740.1 DNA-binding response OmpR family regulator [Desmospora profundinema]
MKATTILLIDDEKEIRDLIEIYLVNDGYRVLKAADGLEGLHLLEHHSVDLLILDVMMPHMDGIQACMKIRETDNIPILMLSAKSQDVDKIVGLGVGADDYVTKPFNPLELMARVKSLLRRYTKLNTPVPKEESVIEIEGLRLNVDSHEVWVEEKQVNLTPKEFAILELLARNRGIVFSRQKIYERVWKERFVPTENTVMVHIRKIREKIEHNPRKPTFIKTVWGVGYKIEK